MIEIHFKKSKRTLFIHPEASSLLARHRQSSGQPETGGVLAGQILTDNNIVVTLAMPPSPKNKAGRFWVERSLVDAQKWIDQIYEESEHKFNYIGEWHTHPAIRLAPSRDDRKMLDDLLKGSRLEMDFLVGIIVGTAGNFYCWIQYSNGTWEAGILT